MNGVIAFLVATLIYPGVLAALVALLVLQWVRSLAGSLLRRGPIPGPLRLLTEIRADLTRETLAPAAVYRWALTSVSAVALIVPLLALILLPTPGNPLVAALGLRGDITAEGALVLGVPLLRLFIGWLTPSPYSRLAADRSARILAGALAPMILALTVMVEQMNTLGLRVAGAGAGLPFTSLAARLLATVAFACALPILARSSTAQNDAAVDELFAGELTELSGRDRALFHIAEALQLVAVCALFTTAFLLPLALPLLRNVSPAGLGGLWLVGLVVSAVGVGLWEASGPNAVNSVDRPPLNWWLGVPALVALLALAVAAWAARGV